MQQFNDGSFGPIIPADNLIRQLHENGIGETEAVFFGSKQQLAEKAQKKLQSTVDDLTARIAELEMKQRSEHDPTALKVFDATALSPDGEIRASILKAIYD